MTTAKKMFTLCVLAGLMLGGCQAGGWRDVSVTMDGLERDLRQDGLVTIKRPDVWTENRLHTYRSEFEAAFKPADDPPFKDFKPNINATAAQVQIEQLGILVDAAIEMSAGSSGPKLSQYLATALLNQFSTADDMTQLDFNSLLQTAVKAFVAKESGVDPATLLGGEPNPETTSSDVDNGGESGAEDSTGEGSETGGDDSGGGAGAGDDTGGGGDTGGGSGAGGDTGGGNNTGGDDTGGGDEPAAQQPAVTNVTQTVEQPSENAEEKKEEKEEKERPKIEFKLNVADILKNLPKTPGIELLSPFEKQAQKRAFVQQNHLFRIGNEPDDGTRMNGYRLYYMRFMVSVTPSNATQNGSSAEILLSPSYNVMDAARDWAAQYARALLRERILRRVESALERATLKLFLEPKRCAGQADQNKPEASTSISTADAPVVGPRPNFPVGRIRHLSDLGPIERAMKEAFEHVAASHSFTEACTDCLAAVADARKSADSNGRIPDDKGRLVSEAVETVKTFLGPSGLVVDGVPETSPAETAVKGAALARKDSEPGDTGSSTKRDSFRDAESLATLRFEFLSMQGLAQLAYDELAREIDYLLGVSNAVQVTKKRRAEAGSIRIERARAALCEIASFENGCVKDCERQEEWTDVAKYDELYGIINQSLARLSDYARAEYERRPAASAQTLRRSPGRSIDLRAELLFEERASKLQAAAQLQEADHDVAFKRKYRFVGKSAFAALNTVPRVQIQEDALPAVVEAIAKAIRDAKLDRGFQGTAPALDNEDLSWLERHLGDLCETTNEQAESLKKDAESLRGKAELMKEQATEGQSLAENAESLKQQAQDLENRARSLEEDAHLYACIATAVEKIRSMDANSRKGSLGEAIKTQSASEAESDKCCTRANKAIEAVAKMIGKKIVDGFYNNYYSNVDPAALRYFFSPKNWPVYTFAVAPFSEVENISRAVQLNSELQFMLSASLEFADMGDIDGALQYIRALREEFRAIQVNRTVVGLVRGEQHFGWQFNPPYSIPVRREHSFFLGDRLVVDEAKSQTMPSRTYEVFALVAVPGFLRSMEFTVHSDWTNSNRSDGTRVGTAKAAKYLRRFRWLQKRVGETWREGKNARDAYGTLDKLTPFGKDSEAIWWEDDDWDEDNIFLGELLADRLDLLEASLPLRKMRKVFLPYADVSERMTNTAGIENLRPKIYQITPFHIPSHHKISITIEGKNFDTGRVQVFVAGIEAKVKIANDRTIVAEVPERKFIGDLDLRTRPTIGENSADFKANVNDLEGLAIVTVVTPVGVVSDYTLIRLTKKELAAPAPPVLTAKLEPNVAICLEDNKIVERPLVAIKLSQKVDETSGTVVLTSEAKGKDTLVAQFAVKVTGDKVLQLEPAIKAGTPHGIDAFAGRSITGMKLVLLGAKGPREVKVTGTLKISKVLIVSLDSGSKAFKVEDLGSGKWKIDPSKLKLALSCAVLKDTKGDLVLTPSPIQNVTFDPKEITIDLGSFGGKEVSANLSADAKNLGKWITAAKTANEKKVVVKLKCKLKGKSGGGEVDVKVDGTFTVEKK